MPPGLAGLLLASIIAVAMSNASGSLNSSRLPAFSIFRGCGENHSIPKVS